MIHCLIYLLSMEQLQNSDLLAHLLIVPPVLYLSSVNAGNNNALALILPCFVIYVVNILRCSKFSLHKEKRKSDYPLYAD